jgi:hypothetical protein
LIRKKHDPPVELWIEEGREIQKSSSQNGEEDIEDLWNWAGEWMSDRIATYVRDEADVEYTAEEEAMGIENVRTGLKDVYESDDEDQEMEDVEVGVTSVSKPEIGQVEFGVGEIKKVPTEPGKTVDEFMRTIVTGKGMANGT